MMFKPSLHGWGFDDSFAAGGPALGLGAAPAHFGLGGGMCWAALDRFLDGRAMPDIDTVPGAGSPLHSEILQRQVAALAGVWPKVREWQALPDGSWRDRLPVGLTPGRRDVASLTRAAWKRVRRSIANGRPVLLTLVHSGDAYARATAARQVLVYDCSRTGAVVTLSIYDPARPDDDEVRLAFSLNGPLDARATGGQKVRGFFEVPYDRVPARCLHAETFADRAVLGLARKVRGVPRAAYGRRALHVVARDAAGALIHFHRRYGRHWDAQNVFERAEVEAPELHSDPTVITGATGLGLHVFARNYVGDLIHFRALRRWRVANRTEHRRAGPRFRLEGAPVAAALPWGVRCVVGRSPDGALVAYSSLPFRGWRAEEVPPPAGGVIEGQPFVATLGPALHVIARARNGHLLHFERTKGGWSVGDLVTLCEGAAPVVGPPVLTVHNRRLHVFGVTADGRLLHLTLGADQQWTGRVALTGVTGDPAVTVGPAGLHVFVAGAGGGLLHGRWTEDRWRVEDLVATRSTAGGGAVPTEDLLAWGAADELRLFGRRDGALVQWIWRADSDWVAGAVADRAGVAARHMPGESPHLTMDRAGSFHLFGTDVSGSVVHVEGGGWRASSARVKSDPGELDVVRPKQGPAASAEEAAEVVAPVPDLTESQDLLEPVDLPQGSSPSEDSLDILNGEAGGFDWGISPAPEDEAGAVSPADLEPLDLERLGSWPPKAPARARQDTPPSAPEASPPPWPDEG